MKVMCINSSEWFDANTHRPIKYSAPKYGEVCNAVDETEIGYKLDEYPDEDFGWDKRSFIPCSEIDEVELAKKREVELV